jgi:hypothetical protein
VTGDGLCIGLTSKSSPAYTPPKTSKNRDLIEAIVSEIRSHEELKDIALHRSRSTATRSVPPTTTITSSVHPQLL